MLLTYLPSTFTPSLMDHLLNKLPNFPQPIFLNRLRRPRGRSQPAAPRQGSTGSSGPEAGVNRRPQGRVQPAPAAPRQGSTGSGGPEAGVNRLRQPRGRGQPAPAAPRQGSTDSWRDSSLETSLLQEPLATCLIWLLPAVVFDPRRGRCRNGQKRN
jgi:hypothetical protein